MELLRLLSAFSYFVCGLSMDSISKDINILSIVIGKMPLYVYIHNV